MKKIYSTGRKDKWKIYPKSFWLCPNTGVLHYDEYPVCSNIKNNHTDLKRESIKQEFMKIFQEKNVPKDNGKNSR